MLSLTVTMEVPQLERVITAIDHLGEILVANFEAHTAAIAALRADLTAEAQQITAKLDELAALMQQDMTDQANLEAATASIEAIRADVQNLVPDAPPAPEPAPQP